MLMRGDPGQMTMQESSTLPEARGSGFRPSSKTDQPQTLTDGCFQLFPGLKILKISRDRSLPTSKAFRKPKPFVAIGV